MLLCCSRRKPSEARPNDTRLNTFETDLRRSCFRSCSISLIPFLPSCPATQPSDHNCLFVFWVFFLLHLTLRVAVTLCRCLTSDTCFDLNSSSRLPALSGSFRDFEAQLLTWGFLHFLSNSCFLMRSFCAYYILLCCLLCLACLFLSLFFFPCLVLLYSLLRRSLLPTSRLRCSISRQPALPYIFASFFTDCSLVVFFYTLHPSRRLPGQH